MRLGKKNTKNHNRYDDIMNLLAAVQEPQNLEPVTITTCQVQLTRRGYDTKRVQERAAPRRTCALPSPERATNTAGKATRTSS